MRWLALAIEALACGVPVITTPVVGASEDIVRAGAGVVVPARVPTALANAIVTLLQNPEQAEKMGWAGRQLVEEKYSWGAVVDEMDRLYSACLSGHSGR